MQLAQQYPEAVVLHTGGKVALTPVAKGAFELGPDILRQLGLSEGRMIVEGRSRTTAENATLSRAMAPDAEGPWILVTSAFHMPRARDFLRCGMAQPGALPNGLPRRRNPGSNSMEPR